MGAVWTRQDHPRHARARGVMVEAVQANGKYGSVLLGVQGSKTYRTEPLQKRPCTSPLRCQPHSRVERSCPCWKLPSQPSVGKISVLGCAIGILEQRIRHEQ